MSCLTRIFTSSIIFSLEGKGGRRGLQLHIPVWVLLKKLFLAVRIIIYLSVLTEIPWRGRKNMAHDKPDSSARLRLVTVLVSIRSGTSSHRCTVWEKFFPLFYSNKLR